MQSGMRNALKEDGTSQNNYYVDEMNKKKKYREKTGTLYTSTLFNIRHFNADNHNGCATFYDSFEIFANSFCNWFVNSVAHSSQLPTVYILYRNKIVCRKRINFLGHLLSSNTMSRANLKRGLSWKEHNRTQTHTHTLP